MASITFPATSSSLRNRLKTELNDWDVESLPAAFSSGKTITIRTHEFVVEPATPFFRGLAIFNKVALVVATLALIGAIGLSVFYSLVLLDNLHAVNVMQAQQPAGAVLTQDR